MFPHFLCSSVQLAVPPGEGGQVGAVPSAHIACHRNISCQASVQHLHQTALFRCALSQGMPCTTLRQCLLPTAHQHIAQQSTLLQSCLMAASTIWQSQVGCSLLGLQGPQAKQKALRHCQVTFCTACNAGLSAVAHKWMSLCWHEPTPSYHIEAEAWRDVSDDVALGSMQGLQRAQRA